MQCPSCGAAHICKNGKKRDKQKHICLAFKRQFIDTYICERSRGYGDDIKQECLKMYVNGMGFRAIERVKGVHHTTVIYWVKQLGKRLPDAPQEKAIPEVGELKRKRTAMKPTMML